MSKGTAGAKTTGVPDWAELRKKGDAILAEMPHDTFAATVLDGALQIGESRNPIRGNLCAAAIRELAGHVLHSLAPNERVSRCGWYKLEPDTNGPTRRQRATYIVQGGLQADFVNGTLRLDHKKIASPLVKAIEALNRATHVREKTILTNDAEIRALVSAAFQGLLDIFEAARTCQREVHEHLADEINDAVFDAFLMETLQELDELRRTRHMMSITSKKFTWRASTTNSSTWLRREWFTLTCSMGLAPTCATTWELFFRTPILSPHACNPKPGRRENLLRIR